MSGDVGAEVAAVLATALHSGVCGPSGDVCCWTEELDRCADADLAGLAQHLADALAPLIAVRVEAAKAEALREAADEMVRLETKSTWDLKAACERGSRNTAYYVGMDDAYSHAGDILRVRADALDPGPRP